MEDPDLAAVPGVSGRVLVVGRSPIADMLAHLAAFEAASAKAGEQFARVAPIITEFGLVAAEAGGLTKMKDRVRKFVRLAHTTSGRGKGKWQSKRGVIRYKHKRRRLRLIAKASRAVNRANQ